MKKHFWLSNLLRGISTFQRPEMDNPISKPSSGKMRGGKLRGKAPEPRRLSLETLEDRQLLAVIIVNTAIDQSSAEWSLTDNVVSLREALYKGSDGDTIKFDEAINWVADANTLTLTHGRLSIAKNLTIDATSVYNADLGRGVTLNGNGSYGNEITVLSIAANSTTSLTGLTITGGYGGVYVSNVGRYCGAGIYSKGTLTITNSTISGNTAGDSGDYGGGIYSTGTVTITNSTISGNTAGDYGGGIYSTGTVTITDSTISGNTAIYGGGIYSKGTLTITNSTISGNNGSYSGGGIDSTGTVTITNSTISGNTAGDYGGGIYSTGTVTITNSTISGNTAGDYGGGLYFTGKQSLSLVNCTVSGNMATNGAGIYNDGGTLKLNNSIVSYNYATAGASNIYGAYSGTNNIIGYNPVFAVAPLFDLAGKLANAATMDLRLRTDSPAVNTGNNAVVLTEKDVDGNRRIYGTTVDLGAYELQEAATTPITYSTVVDTLNDSFDLTDGEWSLREAIFWATDFATITFADNLNGSITLALGELVVDKGLAIDGAGRITIDADQKSRAFYVTTASTDGTVTLDGLTITRGKGGIYNAAGTVAVIDCDILNNAGDGLSNAGALTITNSTLSGNTGNGLSNSGTVTVTGSVITSNTLNGMSDSGTLVVNGNSSISGNTKDGISSSGKLTVTHGVISQNTANGITSTGSLTISDSTVSNNLKIGISSSGKLTVTKSTISGNVGSGISGGDFTVTKSTVSDNTGGGIVGGALTIVGSTISGNTASNSGGGISAGTLTLESSSVTGNSTTQDGGGIYASGATLSVTNSLISGNTASGIGGGLYAADTLTLKSSTVAGNTASSGSGLRSKTVELRNSVVALNNGDGEISFSEKESSSYYSLTAYPESIWSGTPVGNVQYDSTRPLFVNAAGGDYRLAADSQATDVGNNTYAYYDDSRTIAVDLDGLVRIYNVTIDMGAFEYGSAKPILDPLDTPTKFTVTTELGGYTATLSWNAVDNAVGYAYEYRLTDSGDSWVSTTIAGTVATLNLTQTSYDFRVKALGDEENYADSEYTDIITKKIGAAAIATPELTVKTETDQPTATLSWDAIENATGYEYQYKLSSATDWGTTYSTTNLTATVTGLEMKTQYNFRVRAIGDGGLYDDSDWSAIVTKTIGAISLDAPKLDAVIVDTTATLTWNSVRYATSYEYQYRVSGETWSEVVSTTELTATIAELTEWTYYDFRVRAVPSNPLFTESDWTTVGPYRTNLDPLSTPTASVKTGVLSAVITWGGVDFATGYKLQYTSNAASNLWITVPYTLEAGVYTATLQGLTAATNYTYRLKALGDGEYWRDSEWGTQTFTTLEQLDAPTNMGTGEIRAHSITVTWDPVLDADHYTYRWRTSAYTYTDDEGNEVEVEAGQWQEVTGIYQQSGYDYVFSTLTGLAPETAYDFQAQANGPLGTTIDSEWPDDEDFLTVKTYKELATAVFTLTPESQSSIFVDWTAVDHAAGYILYWRESATETTPVGAWNFETFSTSVTEYSIKNLKLGTSYNVYIRTNGEPDYDYSLTEIQSAKTWWYASTIVTTNIDEWDLTNDVYSLREAIFYAGTYQYVVGNIGQIMSTTITFDQDVFVTNPTPEMIEDGIICNLQHGELVIDVNGEKTAAAVENYLNKNAASIYLLLDINDDGIYADSTDLTLLTRYFSGLRGKNLIAGFTATERSAWGRGGSQAGGSNTFELEAYMANLRGLALDVNDDGVYTAEIDGVLISRYLEGKRGKDLIEGFYRSAWKRSEAADIENYIAVLVAENYIDADPVPLLLDVNGDGEVTMAIDGVLISRYFEGQTGIDLIAGFDTTEWGRKYDSLTIDASNLITIENDGFAIGGFTIDAGSLSRGLNIYDGADTITIIGLNFTNGLAQYNKTTGTVAYGGGVYSQAQTLELDYCSVTYNTASAVGTSSSALAYGGGVYATGDAILRRTYLIGNQALADNSYRNAWFRSEAIGGGLYALGDDSIVSYCVVNRNIARADSIYNYAIVKGGGLCLSGDVVNSLVTLNTAMAISEIQATKTGKDGIYAIGYGGGIAQNKELTIVNSTIAKNSIWTSQSKDGEYYSYGGGVCGISSSTADYPITLNNSIVVLNNTTRMTDTEDDICAYHVSDSHPTRTGVFVGNNNISTYSENAWAAGSANNIQLTTYTQAIGLFVDVYDATQPIPNLDPRSESLHEDYHLANGSRAIDAGSGEKAVDENGAVLAVDLDNKIRTIDETCDVGAYEYYGTHYGSLVVTTTDDSDDPDDGETSLREAIAWSNRLHGDWTIYFLADVFVEGGTITLTSALDTINANEYLTSLTVDGLNLSATRDKYTEGGTAAEQITVSGDDAYRVFNVGEINSMTFVNLSIENGAAVNGAGIYSQATNLTVDGCAFVENAASNHGGGIYNSFGALTVEGNSSFTGNTAGKNGGAIMNWQGALTVEGKATPNGTNPETWRFNNIVFQDNSAENSGGAIWQNSGPMMISFAEFSNNSANTNGGAICVNDGDTATTVLKYVTLDSNTAGNHGGAVCFNAAGATLSLINSQVTNNTALADNSRGFGIYVAAGGFVSRNSTIADNVKTDEGGTVTDGSGVMLAVNATGDFYNTILVGNKTDIAGLGTVNGYNVLIETEPTWGTSENIFVYDNTNPLFTDAANGDYSLADNSQAKDLGNDASAIDENGNALLYDLAGQQRFFGKYVDLGAFEDYKKESQSLIVTIREDIVDPYDNETSLREAIALANELGGEQTISFWNDVFAEGGTIFIDSMEFEEFIIGGDPSTLTSLTIDGLNLSETPYVYTDGGTATGRIVIDAQQYSRVFTVGALEEMTFLNLSIENGRVMGNGGGVLSKAQSLIFDDCDFIGNYAGDGGAVYHEGLNAELRGGLMTNNTARYNGGGFYDNGTGGALLSYATITNNSAGLSGGGVYSVGQNLLLINSLVADNTAALTGAGIYNLSSDFVARNSTVSGNGTTSETDSRRSGAGIYNGISARTVLYNSIVALNLNDHYPYTNDIFTETGGWVYGYNTLSSFADWTNTDNEIGPFDPTRKLFVDWEGGDYHLAGEAYQAIKTGDPSKAIDENNVALTVDLDGNDRFDDGGLVDLGAYRFLGETPQMKDTQFVYAVENDYAIWPVSVDANYSAVPGGEVSITIYHDYRDEVLTGNLPTTLSLRIHYDANIFDFNKHNPGYINYQDRVGLTGAFIEVYDDSLDYDHDPTTTKYVLITWNNNNELWDYDGTDDDPVNILNTLFTVKTEVKPENNNQSHMNFTVADLTRGYEFKSNRAVITITPGNYDIDGDGAVNIAADANLILRYFAGRRGSDLTTGLVGEDSTRDDTEIEALIDAYQPIFDINGDNAFTAEIDGVLLTRYLAGFRGQRLIEGLNLSSGTRQTAEAIESFIKPFILDGEIELPTTTLGEHHITVEGNSYTKLDGTTDNSLCGVTGNTMTVNVRHDLIGSTASIGHTLSLRVHYNDTYLSYSDIGKIYLNGVIGPTGSYVVEVQEDTEDYDHDQSTNRYVQITWNDSQNWTVAGVSFPLAELIFSVKELKAGSWTDGLITTQLNFTAGDITTGFELTGDLSVQATLYPSHFVENDSTYWGFDIDGNGQVDIATDGNLLLYYFIGQITDEVVERFTDENSFRQTADEIQNYLEKFERLFDIDGDNTLTVNCDITFFNRYLADFRGDALWKPYIGPKATRTTGEELAHYIEALIPENQRDEVPAAEILLVAENQAAESPAAMPNESVSIPVANPLGVTLSLETQIASTTEAQLVYRNAVNRSIQTLLPERRGTSIETNVETDGALEALDEFLLFEDAANLIVNDETLSLYLPEESSLYDEEIDEEWEVKI